MSKLACILQPFGQGDHIFSMGICQHLIQSGYKIVYPVNEPFVDGNNRAYPHITFLPDTAFDPEMFLIKEIRNCRGMLMVPIRWSDEILKQEARWWMRTKYDLYGLDYKTWKDYARWKRSANEAHLYYDVLGLVDGEKYNLINMTYRSNFSGKVPIHIENGLRNVEMSIIPGYSIFDWAMVIQFATNIHVVNSAILYLLELLPLQAKETHIYCRKPDEVDFRYVEYLMSPEKKYILHQ